ncbi:MAG: hypothetical protein ABL955_03720 [Elusimicrobiota bacterium]
MRALALAVVLTACAGPKPAPHVPPEPNQGPYAIAERYNLPLEEPPSYPPESASRAAAVLDLSARTNQVERGENAKYSWEPMMNLTAELDALLAEKAPTAFRRWAAHTLFMTGSSEVRGRITLDPLDTAVDEWWKRYDAIRARGQADKDPILAEFFERYAQDPEAPRWRDTRAAAIVSRDKMLKARPEMKKHLDYVWGMLTNVTEAQLTVLARLNARTGARQDVPAARREKLQAIETSWVDHRLRITWANMLPRIVVESTDAATAKSFGFVPAPVRTGWPELPAR